MWTFMMKLSPAGDAKETEVGEDGPPPPRGEGSGEDGREEEGVEEALGEVGV